MKEIGIINRDISRLISEQGHGDLLMVVDAGFATPNDIEVVDISLSENTPKVTEVLEVLSQFYSVEKMIIANETKMHNPSTFVSIKNIFKEKVKVQLVNHNELKKLSKNVKAIIRTGDFTAYGNVILVSAAGDRWFFESL